MKKHNISEDKIFTFITIIILVILAVAMVAPLLLIVSASITDENALIANGYQFIPEKVSFSAYQYLWQQRGMILHSYGISILVTVVGTFLSVLLTMLMAYPLSRRDYKLRNFFSFVVFFTMLFNGGFVPSYMVWTRIFQVKNTLAALIFPTYLMGAFNVILVKNYYQNSIPTELIEAAKIDGAGEMTVFAKVMLPLSTPVLTTIALFSGVAYWNDWMNGLYYITDQNLYSIQTLLNRLLNNINFLKSGNAFGSMGTAAAMNMPSVSIRMAIAVVAIIPLLLVFPFLQKSLIIGVVIGAVKG